MGSKINELSFRFHNEETKLGELCAEMISKVIVNHRLVSWYRMFNYRAANATSANALRDIAAIMALAGKVKNFGR